MGQGKWGHKRCWNRASRQQAPFCVRFRRGVPAGTSICALTLGFMNGCVPELHLARVEASIRRTRADPNRVVALSSQQQVTSTYRPLPATDRWQPAPPVRQDIFLRIALPRPKSGERASQSQKPCTPDPNWLQNASERKRSPNLDCPQEGKQMGPGLFAH